MSAPRIRGDYQALAQVAQNFGEHANQINAALQRLKQQKETLANGDWMGQGATAFYAEMDADVLPAIKKLAHALQTARQVTEQMSQVIKQAEDDAAAVFRQNGQAGTASPANPVTQVAPDPAGAPKFQGSGTESPIGDIIGGIIGGAIGAVIGIGAQAGATIGAQIGDFIEDTLEGERHVETPPVDPGWPTPPDDIIPHNQHDTDDFFGANDHLGPFNSCGPSAASAAGEALELGSYDELLTRFNDYVANNPDSGYSTGGGIQPADYAAMTQAVLGDSATVTVVENLDDAAALDRLRQEIANGNQVIVDYLSANQANALPDGNPASNHVNDSYAHFARVVGFSPDGQTIYLAQSLEPGTNGPTIAVPVSDFLAAWENPEERAEYDLGRENITEPVTNWMMVITPNNEN